MDVVLAIRSSRGHAAMPTTSIPDAADGNTWVTFCDSARKLVKSVDGNAWTVGAGGWLMNLATRVVIRFSFGWRKTELDLLCISTLEAKCQEVALFIVSVIAPTQPNVVVWCLQYGDNLAESQHDSHRTSEHLNLPSSLLPLAVISSSNPASTASRCWFFIPFGLLLPLKLNSHSEAVFPPNPVQFYVQF